MAFGSLVGANTQEPQAQPAAAPNVGALAQPIPAPATEQTLAAEDLAVTENKKKWAGFLGKIASGIDETLDTENLRPALFAAGVSLLGGGGGSNVQEISRALGAAGTSIQRAEDEEESLRVQQETERLSREQLSSQQAIAERSDATAKRGQDIGLKGDKLRAKSSELASARTLEGLKAAILGRKDVASAGIESAENQQADRITASMKELQLSTGTEKEIRTFLEKGRRATESSKIANSTFIAMADFKFRREMQGDQLDSALELTNKRLAAKSFSENKLLRFEERKLLQAKSQYEAEITGRAAVKKLGTVRWSEPQELNGKIVQQSSLGEIKVLDKNEKFSEPFEDEEGRMFIRNMQTNRTHNIANQGDIAALASIKQDVQDQLRADTLTIGLLVDRDGRRLSPDTERGTLRAAGVVELTEKQADELTSFKSSGKQAIDLMTNIYGLLAESPDSITFGGSMANFLVNLGTNVRSIGRLFPNPDGTPRFEGYDAVTEHANHEDTFNELGVTRGVMRSMILDLVYLQAISTGQDGKTLSDADVRNFINIVGSSESNPDILRAILARLEGRFSDAYKRDAEQKMNLPGNLKGFSVSEIKTEMAQELMARKLKAIQQNDAVAAERIAKEIRSRPLNSPVRLEYLRLLSLEDQAKREAGAEFGTE